MRSFAADLVRAAAQKVVDATGAGIGSAGAAALSRGLLYFPHLSQALSRIPFSVGWKIRRAAYAKIFASMGHDSVIHEGVVFDDSTCSIGANVWISQGCYIERAAIEDHVLIGPHAVLLAGGSYHRMDRTDVPIKQQGNLPRPTIRIGRGAWIGANATVMADVGHDAVVGAGSVVTKPVAPFAIVAGNPARLLRMRHPLPEANNED